MRRLWVLIAVLIPVHAQALDYRNQSLMYLDAPFLPAEAAGLSVLTTIGAVEGNPDGTFQPERTLNRAEFLKIALGSHPRIAVTQSDADRCFPDVGRTDWYSKYVCLAKKRGVVTGYLDGLFRPESPVNYAEALKILGELYDYTAYADSNAPWYEVYVQAAKNHKTILPINLPYDRLITRGQMVRLAAAFRAEYEGELAYYRRAEKGEYVVVEEEIVGEEREAPEKAMEEKSPPEPEAVDLTPIQSSILVVGERQPIADAQIFTRESPVELRIVKVILKREARTFSGVFLRDIQGKEIAKLQIDKTDRKNETWIETFEPGESKYTLPARTGTTFIVDAALRTREERGFSEEMVEVKNLYVMVGNIDDPTQQYQIVPSNAHYPAHQTAFTRILRVENLLDGEGALQQGPAQKLTSVRIEYRTGSGVVFGVRNLRFWVRSFPDIRTTNWEIRSPENAQRYACTTEETDSRELSLVNCLAIPEELGTVRVFDLYGDIDLTDADRGDTLQINLEKPGSLSEMGDIRWTDGSADFQWVDLPGPLVEGRVWKY